MELINTPTAELNCYSLKPIVFHFHIKTESEQLRCDVLYRFPKKNLTLASPSFEVTPNRSNTVRINGLESLPEEITSFITQLRFTDEHDNVINTKTKVKLIRNSRTQAYLNLNQRGTRVHYLLMPEHNWDPA